MARIAFFADLHLGGALRQRKELWGESYYVLDLLSKALKGKKLDAVVSAGDFFDAKQIDGMSIRSARKFLNALEVPLYSIVGNHDKGKVDMLESLDVATVTNFNKKTVNINDTVLYGLDYHRDNKKQLNEVPECDILVTHNSYQHLLSYEGAWNLSMDMVPQRAKNVFSGDIHTTKITDLPDKRGVFVSPGSLYANKISESSPKGYYIYDDGDWEFVEIPYRDIYRLTEEDLESLLETPPNVTDTYLKPIIEIVYDIDKQSLIDDFKRTLDYVFIEAPYKKSAIGDIGFVSEKDVEDEKMLTMVDMLPYVVKEKGKRYDRLSQLLQGHSVKEVFEDFTFIKGK